MNEERLFRSLQCGLSESSTSLLAEIASSCLHFSTIFGNDTLDPFSEFSFEVKSIGSLLIASSSDDGFFSEFSLSNGITFFFRKFTYCNKNNNTSFNHYLISGI